MAKSATIDPTALSRSALQRMIHTVRIRLLRRDLQRLLANLLVIIIIGSVVHARTGLFWRVSNWQAISVQIAVVTICACAMTLVMIAGHIDVSVPGMVVLGGIVAGLLIRDFEFPVWLAFALAVVAGGIVGLFNAALVLGVGITSLIATIGTLYMTQGVANLLTNGLPIAGLPASFMTVGGGRISGVPWAVPIIVVVVGLFGAIQRFTLLGRWIVATGSNRHSAFLNGVNVLRTTTVCFVLSGAASGFGGVFYSSRLGNPAPLLDDLLLFQVIVAIVLGGTSLFGGEGSVIGTLLGAVLIGTVNNGLNLMGISTFWQYISLGVLLILSVGLDTVLRRERVYRLVRNMRARMRGRPHSHANDEPSYPHTIPSAESVELDSQGGETGASSRSATI